MAILLGQVFYGGILRPVLAIPGLAVLALAAVACVVLVALRDRPAPRGLPLVTAAAFAAWMIFRTWPEVLTAEAAGWQRLVLGCATMYFLFACGVTGGRARLAFFAVLFAGLLVQAGVGAYQFLRNTDSMPIPWVSEQLRLWYGGRATTRAHGFFFNGNHLAWFLNTASLCALAVGIWSRWPSWARIVATYLAAVGFAACLPTLSRGGFIGLAAGLSVFLFASAVALATGGRGRRLAFSLAVAGGVAVAAGSAFLVFSKSFQIQDRLARLTQETYRPMVFETTSRLFQEDPILGGGPGSFRWQSRMVRSNAIAGDDMWAHNDWAQIAAEYGFPALALLGLFVVVHAGAGLAATAGAASRSRGETSNDLAVATGGLSAFAACVVHSGFDFNMQITANALLAAAIAGMLANPGFERPDASALRRAIAALAARILPVGVFGFGLALGILVWRDAGREKALLDAENALLAGRPDRARGLSTSMLRMNPADPDFRIMRARAALDDWIPSTPRSTQVRDARAAAEDLRAASDILPLDVFAEISLATAEGRAGNFRAAEEAAARAIALYPYYHGGYDILGLALLGQNRNAEALRIYALAMQFPNSETSRDRFRALRKMEADAKRR